MAESLFASKPSFPPLPLASWKPTRDTLHSYCQVLGRIRRALTPPQSHWSHVSLRIVNNSISTTVMPLPGTAAGGKGGRLEIGLRPLQHKVVITTDRDDRWEMPLTGQSTKVFSQALLSALAGRRVPLEIDRPLLADDAPRIYNKEDVESFWRALSLIHEVLQEFKAELDQQRNAGQTSPVQFWPHGFDLALLWFSGRKVPGVDPADEENADEQMNFGFSTGDAGIAEPYFFITAYPWQDALLPTPLPFGATWHTRSWKGALLPYENLAGSQEPENQLLEFLQSGYAAASALMKR